MGGGGGGCVDILSVVQGHLRTRERVGVVAWNDRWVGARGAGEVGGGGGGRIGCELLPTVKATRRVGLIAWRLRRLLGSVVCL